MLGYDVHFGTVTDKIDWRDAKFADNSPDDDEELATTPADVVAMLGFDPFEEDFEKVNECHDARGRFCSGSSHASFVSEAKGLRKKAEEVEPEMTATLQTIADTFGGHLEGLDFKFKTEESLVRKMKTKAETRGTDAEFEASRISDALRYTIILPEKEYSLGAKKAMNEFEGRGQKVLEMDNFWVPGAEYKGFHTMVKAKNGLNVEVQIHTQKSFDLKMKELHPMYEKFRTTKDPVVKDKLFSQMQKLSGDLPVPPGISDLCCLKRRPYTPASAPAQ